jgi:hypothetical protein
MDRLNSLLFVPALSNVALFVGKMNLSDEVDLEDYVARPDRISGSIMYCSSGSIKSAQV